MLLQFQEKGSYRLDDVLEYMEWILDRSRLPDSLPAPVGAEPSEGLADPVAAEGIRGLPDPVAAEVWEAHQKELGGVRGPHWSRRWEQQTELFFRQWEQQEEEHQARSQERGATHEGPPGQEMEEQPNEDAPAYVDVHVGPVGGAEPCVGPDEGARPASAGVRATPGAGAAIAFVYFAI